MYNSIPNSTHNSSPPPFGHLPSRRGGIEREMKHQQSKRVVIYFSQSLPFLRININAYPPQSLPFLREDVSETDRGDYIRQSKKHVIPAKTMAECWKSYIKNFSYLCSFDNLCLKFVKEKRGSDGRPSSLLEWDTSYPKFAERKWESRVVFYFIGQKKHCHHHQKKHVIPAEAGIQSDSITLSVKKVIKNLCLLE